MTLVRLGFVSDIHWEMRHREISCPETDILVIAGDLHSTYVGAREVLQRFRKITSAPIIYVMGNHEYYRHDFSQVLDGYKRQVSKVKDVHLLECEEITLRGIRFLGTTLWSNLSNPLDALAAKSSLSDFAFIMKNGRRISPQEYTDQWEQSWKWLDNALEEEIENTVVITHHSPTPATCALQYVSSPIRNCFHSNLSRMIEQRRPKLWVYGHDHVDNQVQVYDTLLFSNQIGYPGEGKKCIEVKVMEII